MIVSAHITTWYRDGCEELFAISFGTDKSLTGLSGGRSFHGDWSANRTDLIAVLESIRWYTVNKSSFQQYGLSTSEGCDLIVYTPSRYVIDHIGEDLDRWSLNGWIKHNGRSQVANADLWRLISIEMGNINSFKATFAYKPDISSLGPYKSVAMEGASYGSAVTRSQSYGHWNYNLRRDGTIIGNSIVATFSEAMPPLYTAPGLQGATGGSFTFR